MPIRIIEESSTAPKTAKVGKIRVIEPGSPVAVVRPASTAEVASVVRVAAAHGIAIITRGAGTGLSGGALPHKLGVTLSLAKFNKILKVDAASRTALVQGGVRNLAISEAVASLGLYYAPDPSSQIACTIGGNVAENAGGVHCLKYGLTVHNILSMNVLTVAGEEITLGSLGLDSPSR